MKDNSYLVNRITTANGPQLVALLYEELINLLKKALQCMQQENLQEENKKEINQFLSKGRDILSELLITLEGDSQITINLRSIYLFINRLMTEAVNQKSPLKLEEAIKVLTPLCEGWKQLGEEQLAEPLQKTVVKVTGYTYGKNRLNDFINPNEDKWKKG